MSRKILILTSSTGGGHDMRASALAAWARDLTDWEIHRHQTLESTHSLYAFGVKIYNRIQRTLPVAHHLYFQFLELAGLHKNADRILGTSSFLERLDCVRPDLIVSTHAHLNHGFFELAKKHLGHSQVKCVTYCGELWGGYGFSRHWVNPRCDGFIGAVETCREQALRLGMPEAKTLAGGFLLRPDFHRLEDNSYRRESVLCDELELDPALRTILLSTGAIGANNHLALLHCLESRRQPLQVVVLCGHSEKTRAEVERWTRRARHLQVRALPRQEDMPRLIQSCDLLVARPGTGTTSEAIMCGTPIAFNCIGGVMPQEYLTVKFSRHAGFARVINWPHQLARFVDELDRDPGLADSLRAAIHRARPARRPNDIINWLQALSDTLP